MGTINGEPLYYELIQKKKTTLLKLWSTSQVAVILPGALWFALSICCLPQPRWLKQLDHIANSSDDDKHFRGTKEWKQEINDRESWKQFDDDQIGSPTPVSTLRSMEGSQENREVDEMQRHKKMVVIIELMLIWIYFMPSAADKLWMSKDSWSQSVLGSFWTII